MSTGLYIGLRPAPEDAAMLAEWAQTLPLARRVPADMLHITMLKRRNGNLPHFAPLGDLTPPIAVDLTRCHFTKYKIESGGLALALAMPDSWMFKRRAEIKRVLTLPKDCGKFFPHISLCYDALALDDDDMATLRERLPIPTLHLIEEYANPVIDNYATAIR